MELEPSTGFEPLIDTRPRVEQPLPVRLVAIADVHLRAPAGAEPALDALYIGILAMARVTESCLAYWTENFRVVFDIVEGIVIHEDYHPLALEVPSLADIERRLTEAEYEHTRQRGLTPGQESLLLTDAAGNWLRISQWKLVG
jgi:hypothetical protein